MQKWIVSELLGPVARRVGGQAAAALVALGMAQVHEGTVAAVVAWMFISVGEVIVSGRNRKAIFDKARDAWGRN